MGIYTLTHLFDEGRLVLLVAQEEVDVSRCESGLQK